MVDEWGRCRYGRMIPKRKIKRCSATHVQAYRQRVGFSKGGRSEMVTLKFLGLSCYMGRLYIMVSDDGPGLQRGEQGCSCRRAMAR